MTTIQDYINRLEKIGYTEIEAKEIVYLYDRQRNLSDLENYIVCKESLEAID